MGKTSINATNAQVLTGLQDSASPALQSALSSVIDNPTSRVNAEAAFTAITSNTTLMNEFVTGLFNVWGNPLLSSMRAWRSPMRNLYRDDLFYGEGFPEIAVRLFRSHQYYTGIDNENPGSVFKQEPPDVVEMYHRINHRKYYKKTENYNILRDAFLGEYGLGRFVTSTNTQLFNSAEVDSYEDMVKVLTDNYKFGKMRQVHIDEPTASPENAKKMVKLEVNMAKHFQFMSSAYNPTEMDTFTPQGDIMLFVTPEVDTEQQVEVLASAFNMDKAEFAGNVIIVESFGDTGIKALMCDRDAFICFKKLFQVESIYDPEHLAITTFLHDHALYSFSKFMNCVAFTTDEVNVSGVTKVAVTAGNVKKGQTLQCSATVTGDSSNNVYWTVANNLDPSTYVNEKGVLYCGSKEPVGHKIKVAAYAKKNNTVSGSADATVE